MEDSSRLNRGNACLALQIASDPARKDLAMKQFGSLALSLNTQNTKESLFSLWERICKRGSLMALPVTEQNMIEVASILRASGYKAVTAYVQEAKSRHVKAGYVWDSKLNLLFGEVKRAAKRAQGPATRAEDIKMDWWDALIYLLGIEPRCLQCHGREPVGGAYVWLLATRFVLRETELAGLTIDANGIRLDLTMSRRACLNSS